MPVRGFEMAFRGDVKSKVAAALQTRILQKIQHLCRPKVQVYTSIASINWCTTESGSRESRPTLEIELVDKHVSSYSYAIARELFYSHTTAILSVYSGEDGHQWSLESTELHAISYWHSAPINQIPSINRQIESIFQYVAI